MMAATLPVSIDSSTAYRRVLESVIIFGSLLSVVLLFQLATTDYSPRLKLVTRPITYGHYAQTPTGNQPIVGWLTADFWSKCCGLGNLLFLYASLRGIAADLNRTAYLLANKCFRDYWGDA
jgi:hypothetical protein